MASDLIIQPVAGDRHLDRLNRRMTHRTLALLLLAPAAALLVVFFAWPLVSILLRSLNVDGRAAWDPDQLTVDHYAALLDQPALRAVLRNTVSIAVTATLASLCVAYPTAYFLSRLSRRLAGVLLVLVLLPFWTSILIRLYTFTQILGRRGVVNDLAERLGLGPFELLFNRTAAVIGMVHYLTPFLILILYSSMCGVDHSLLAASKSLGASSFQTYRRVFFPLTKPALVAGTLLAFVIALGFFLTPAILGGRRDITMATYIQQKVSVFEWGRASAMGVCLLVATVVLFALAIRISGAATIVGRLGGSQRGTSFVEPLRLSWFSIVLGAFTSVVLIFLVSPLAVIVPASFGDTSNFQFPPHGLSWRWYHELFTEAEWMSATTRSARIAVVVALLACIASVMAARGLSMVTNASVRSVIIALLYAPVVTPVILLAIGLFDVEGRLGLLGTDFGLVMAHSALALPFAFAVISNAMAGIDPNLEAAARSLGAGALRAFVAITLRLIAPTLAGAAVIAFVTSWDEVVVSQFIAGLDKTLPVTIFSYLKTGVPPTVAAVGALTVAIVAAGLVFGLSLSVFRGRKVDVDSGGGRG